MIPSDLIERASTVRIEDEIERRGIKLVGRVDRCGPCPQCGGKDRFSINVRKQVFLCRGCAARGNVIALVRFLDGCGFHEALEYLTGERAPAPSRPAPAATDAPRDDDRDARALILARQIALRPILGSSFHDGDDRAAARVIHEGRKVGKAKTLGSPAGIIRLTPDEDVLGRLHIAEGLETALAGMSKGLRPMWAAGSTALMAKLPAVSGIKALTIIADHDANGAGERAAAEVAARWREAGKEARVWRPKSIGDLNDILIGGAK